MVEAFSREAKAAISAGDDATAKFHARNPDFDLANFDFYAPGALDALPKSARDSSVQAALRAQQRILRVAPDGETARKLLDAGYDSAHAIASVPEHRFIRETLALFDGNDEAARATHRRARSVKGAVKHLYANLHSTLASPHFGSMLANNVGADLAYFRDMPSYQSLFGSLNYCTCRHCASIFGPAAYFLDMMRITEDYITDPNTTKAAGNIPAGYRLDQRRPDLFELPLTCASTDNPVPTLTIVNQILERTVAGGQPQTSGTAVAGAAASITLAASASATDDAYTGMWIMITAGTGLGQLRTIAGYSGSTRVAAVASSWAIVPDATSAYVVAVDPYQVLAAAPFPFNLPENLPLIEIRRYLAALRTTLPQVYTALQAPQTGGTAQAGGDATLTLATGASTTSGAYSTMRLMLVAGTGAGQNRSITAYDGTSLIATVDEPWSTVPDGTTRYLILDALPAAREVAGLSIEQYAIVTTPLSSNAEIAPFYGYTTIDLDQISRVEIFLTRTGLSWDQLEALLTQELSASELAAGDANAFFINSTAENLPPMAIVANTTDPDLPYFQIANLSLQRLDRLNRFIRLAAALGWSYAALDWALKSTGEDAINEAAIKAFAGMQELARSSGLDIVTLTSLWAPMKTVGKGNGPAPIDLFDRIFNSPALLRGQNPYTSVAPIPFDPARPLTWTVADTGGQNGVIRGRLLGALNVGDDDLTRVALFTLAGTGGSGDALELNLANLTWLYRLTKAASIFGLTVDAYLLLLGMISGRLRTKPRFSEPTVSAVLQQKALVDWFVASPFTVYSALYILTGITTPYFTPAYRPDDIAPFVQNLATASAPSRLTPQNFVFGEIDAGRADRLFARLIRAGFLTGIGIMLSPDAQYQAASASFPLTAQSFVSADISAEEAAEVFAQLKAAHPPILLPAGDGSEALLARHVNPLTPLDFLFAGEEDAPNRRNEVMAVLMATRAEILFTELAFAFPLPGDAFVSRDIDPAASQRSLQALAAQSPPLVSLDPAAGQTGTVQSYAGTTRTATLAAAWPKPAGPSSVYTVLRQATSGKALAGTLTTVTLAESASTEPAAYVGMELSLTGGTGAGQTATVAAYDGATRVATVAPAWVTLPDATTDYSVSAPVAAGIAVAGTETTITFEDTASAVDGAYDGMTVVIGLSGQLTTSFSAGTPLPFLFDSKGAGQSAAVSAYDGATRTATVAAAWATAPDSTSAYRMIQTVQQGTAQGGTLATIQLAADASDQDGAYSGMTVALTGGTGLDQTGTIFGYEGATRTATLLDPWTTAPDDTSAYVVTHIVTAGTARAGGATTIALDAAASPTDGAYVGMTIAIVADPGAESKRGQVMQDLLTQRQNIAHSVGVLGAAETLQEGNAMQGLADFLGTTPERLRNLIPVATQAANLADYLDDLLTPIERGQVPPALPPFIAALSRSVVLFDTLAYTIPEILAVVEIPQAFAIGDPQVLELGDLASFEGFKELVRRFGGQSDRLIDYLRRPPDETCPGATTAALSALTHWPAAQICQLEALFWPSGAADAPQGPGTVTGLLRLDSAFRISAATGLDISSLLQINALGTLPVAAGGTVVSANWQAYANVADMTLAAVKAKFGDGDFASVNDSIVSDLNEARRDMLLGYTVWLLQKTYSEITSPERLYQYLLIDVEMCGCDTTSYVAQGISAVQLYMQRCRLMLEPGVTDLSNIPDIWWEWMSAYRVWEANRKIFLYPENYLDPALRQDRTPQFTELVDALMQTDINANSVATAYQGYFDSFSRISQLTRATAYGCRIPQAGTKVVQAQGTARSGTAQTIVLASGSSPIFNAYVGMTVKITAGTGAGQVNAITGYDGFGTATVAVNWTTAPDSSSAYVITGQALSDTLFLVAHTNTQPPVYYWRKRSSDRGWTPWTEIELSIASPLVSPIYAFNRLHLFWAEQKVVEGSKISSSSGNASSTTVSDVTASLRFSYCGNDGMWIAPQTIAEDKVITYEIAYALDPYVANAMGGYAPYFDPDRIFWLKPYPLHIGPARLVQPSRYPTGDQLFLSYGLNYAFSVTGPMPVPNKPPTTMPRDQFEIQSSTWSLVQRYNAIVAQLTGPTQYLTGSIQFEDTNILNDSLVNSTLNTVLISGSAGLVPQPYYPFLSSQALGVSLASNWNLILADYLADAYPGVNNGELGSQNPVSLLGNVSTAASISTVKNIPGSFLFDNGDETFLVRSSDRGILPIDEIVNGSVSYPPLPSGQFYIQTQTFTLTNPAPALSALKFSFERMTTTAGRTLTTRLLRGGIPLLLTLESQLVPEPPFSRLSPTTTAVPPPSDRLDFRGAYGLYFWEVFFHAPFLVAEALRANQRFDEAKQWFEYIYNPTQQPETGADLDSDRYWRFLPFRDMNVESLTEILTDPAQIAAYNDDPFDPDAIARLRTSSYAKAIVMKYISNLIAWGDQLFAQDTRESINQATNLYVLASDLLGPRPIAVGECNTPAPMSFNDVKREYDNQTIATGTAAGGGAATITLASSAPKQSDVYDGYYISITAGTGSGQTAYITAYAGKTQVAAVDPPWQAVPDSTSQYRIFAQGIPQFLIRLENTPTVAAASTTDVPYSDMPFNDINSYFCVPENAELIAYWDVVDDRLFKIRHCMNLAGQVRPLALFAPPIDPRALIQAANAGAGSLGFSAQLDSPIPYYRFSALIERAKGLAGAAMQLGGSLLAALEKGDAETLAQLRTAQEATILQLTTLIKQQQVEEVKETGLALQDSLKSAQKRQSYYNEQISGGLSDNEIQNIVYMTLATVFNTMAGATRTMASIGYALPQVGSPFAMTYGGKQIGAALTAASGVLEGLGILANFGAQLNLTMAQYRRREGEWQLQSDLAGFDVAQIQYQILANDARQTIADQDLKIHQAAIAQNAEIAAFLKDKFTDKALYQWMSARLSVLYYQTYSLAVELARSVQRAYNYEMNVDTAFVNFGYWEGGRRGLLAGEGLMLALNQMEKSYLDRNSRTLEIEKTVSLLQLNPRALLDFIATGECIFELPEKLFDDDFPGHYCRKIAGVAVSIPAITGPYQNLHATLTQLSNQVVVKPDLNAIAYLLGEPDATLPDGSILRSNWWANQNVVLSRGLSDSGQFEPTMHDERYLPFEGTGAVSTWRLSMPKSTNHFDFHTITDVLVQLRYTAYDGGAKLRQDVTRLPAMRSYSGSAFFACAQRFSTQWYQFLEQPVSTVEQTLSITLEELVPDHVGRPVLTGFLVQLVTPAAVDPTAPQPYITLTMGKAAPVTFAPDRDGRYVHLYSASPRVADVQGPATIRFDLGKTPASLKQHPPAENLDPATLHNIALTLFYEGEVRWP
jgi:hypothetical protein